MSGELILPNEVSYNAICGVSCAYFMVNIDTSAVMLFVGLRRKPIRCCRLLHKLLNIPQVSLLEVDGLHVIWVRSP